MATRAEEYRAVAENVVSRYRENLGVELKYDEASIEWLDGYINRIRPELKQASYAGLAVALGAYLGETIIETYGGAWNYFEQLDQWGIRFDDDNGAFPISKVRKQLEDGELDSILSFFTFQLHESRDTCVLNKTRMTSGVGEERDSNIESLSTLEATNSAIE